MRSFALPTPVRFVAFVVVVVPGVLLRDDVEQRKCRE